MKKKLIWMICTILITCTCLGGFSVMATQANVGEIAVEDVTAKPGDIIEVPVVLRKNPGIVSLYISIGYDDEALKLNDVTDSALLTDYQSGDKKLNPFTVSWEMASATENNVSTGTLVVLNFTVLETAETGKYEITVEEYGTGNVYDYDLNDVEFEYQLGIVSVEVPVHEHIWSDWANVRKATCTETGLNKRECTVAGCDEVDSEIVPVLGHNLGNWEVEKEAGINEEGLKRRTAGRMPQENCRRRICMQSITEAGSQSRDCGRDGNIDGRKRKTAETETADGPCNKRTQCTDSGK